MKSWVDEILQTKRFIPFSVQTIELTKKFNARYNLFKGNNSIKYFQELVAIAKNFGKQFFAGRNL